MFIFGTGGAGRVAETQPAATRAMMSSSKVMSSQFKVDVQFAQDQLARVSLPGLATAGGGAVPSQAPGAAAALAPPRAQAGVNVDVITEGAGLEFPAPLAPVDLLAPFGTFWHRHRSP